MCVMLLLEPLTSSSAQPRPRWLQQPEQTQTSEDVHSMKLVEIAEAMARLHAVSPRALLIVDLANVLSRGGMNTDSRLLLIRPKISDWLSTTTSRAHTELSDALAAPLKIVFVTTQHEYLKNAHFLLK